MLFMNHEDYLLVVIMAGKVSNNTDKDISINCFYMSCKM